MNQTPDPYKIAQTIKAAQNQNRQIEPFTAQFRSFDEALAYEVSGLVHEARISEGAVPVGRKLGFTNPEMWSLYGVKAPIWAHVYDRTVTHISGGEATCRIGGFSEPKIEPEIVIHFGSAPPVSDDPAEILSSVDWVAHGIEIVQSHYPGWEFQAADTIADAALHATLLVGEPLDVTRAAPGILSDLKQFTVTLACDGEVLEQGSGANALGSPVSAIAHLISVIAGQPDAPPIKAGELVTTGTLTPALPVLAGQRWTTRIEGIPLPGLSVLFKA